MNNISNFDVSYDSNTKSLFMQVLPNKTVDGVTTSASTLLNYDNWFGDYYRPYRENHYHYGYVTPITVYKDKEVDYFKVAFLSVKKLMEKNKIKNISANQFTQMVEELAQELQKEI